MYIYIYTHICNIRQSVLWPVEKSRTGRNDQGFPSVLQEEMSGDPTLHETSSFKTVVFGFLILFWATMGYLLPSHRCGFKMLYHGLLSPISSASFTTWKIADKYPIRSDFPTKALDVAIFNSGGFPHWIPAVPHNIV